MDFADAWAECINELRDSDSFEIQMKLSEIFFDQYIQARSAIVSLEFAEKEVARLNKALDKALEYI